MKDVATSPGDERRRPAGGLLRVVAIAFVVAAIVKELRLAPQDRTWHGSVAGFVPYDFRVPTLGRARERLWSPSSHEIVVPTIFGVGWTLNVGRVVTLVRNRTRD
jgi:hypothetical protein